MTVGMANCIVQRVSYTADLGYEIFCDHMSVRHLWDTLSAAGQDLGLRPFGMRAMMSPAAGQVVRLLGPRVQPRLHPGRNRA